MTGFWSVPDMGDVDIGSNTCIRESLGCVLFELDILILCVPCMVGINSINVFMAHNNVYPTNSH